MWHALQQVVVDFLRSDAVPAVDELYITSIFGEGKNGIRERAWLRFVSGNLDIEKLKLARVKIKGVDKHLK